ncbi:hypothetical protein K1719_043773 [Acacia pycnantha]|nr:hypothetical protein K1719_043773 [Acacia pycnantha]
MLGWNCVMYFVEEQMKSGSRRSKGIADEVVRKAPENCDVKVICEGKDVIFDIVEAASPRSTAASPHSTGSGSTPTSGNYLGHSNRKKLISISRRFTMRSEVFNA